MDKKKSLTKAGSSAKNTSAPAKKTAEISPVKAGKKPEGKVKTAVSRAKAAPEKGKSATTAGEKEKAKKKSPAKIKTKPAAGKTEAIKTPEKKAEKPADISKSATPGKKLAKKSPGRAAVSTAAPKKTVEAVKPKKTAPALKEEKKSAEKKVKASPGKKSVLKETSAKTKKTEGKSPSSKKKAEPSRPAAPGRRVKKKTSAAYAVHPRKEKIPKRFFDLRVFLPEEEFSEDDLLLPASELPEEYGENELLLMEVDPSIVFASWEIKPEAIAGKTGRLILRVYDVTGIDFEEAKGGRFFDIPLAQRVDSKFFDIKMPGKELIMEIGLLYPEGSFTAIERSHRVSMPELQNFEELGIFGKSGDSEKIVGY